MTKKCPVTHDDCFCPFSFKDCTECDLFRVALSMKIVADKNSEVKNNAKVKWVQVNVVCSNYRVGCKGTTTTVTINSKRVCTSDCEAVWCPLHQSETHKLPEKELGDKRE